MTPDEVASYVQSLPRLVRTIRRATGTSEEIADEAASEALYRGVRYADKIRPATAFNWLVTVAVHLVMDGRRRARLAPPVLSLSTDLAAWQLMSLASRVPSPLENAIRHECEDALKPAIVGLPQIDQTIIRLCLDGHKQHEIGTVCQLSRVGVATRLRRARATLRRRLGPLGATPV